METPIKDLVKWTEYLRKERYNLIRIGDVTAYIEPPSSKEERLDAILFGTMTKFEHNETTFVVYLNTDNIAFLTDVYNNPLKTSSDWKRKSNKTKWHEFNK